ASRLLAIPVLLVLNQFQLIVPRTRRLLRLSRIADAGLLTLIGRGWALSDEILIPDFPPPYTIALGNLRIPKPYRSRVKLIGPILPVKPSQLPSVNSLRDKLGLDPGKPFVYVSVSGPRREKAPLIKLLVKVFRSLSREYEVVMSLAEPGMAGRVVRLGGLRIYYWVPNKFECLKACDVVVSRAGHETIVQSICYGKPLIVIPTPGHTEQYANARRVKELGFGKVIEQEKLSVERMAKALEEIVDRGVCKPAVEKAMRENSGRDGLEAIVDAIVRMGSAES
ncbi:MAG: glycosyltransferase, partial [Candidatus Freyarchaeota archaeon]